MTQNKRILIVDDDANERESMADLLIEHGFTVLQAANGEEAIATASLERPALVLLDTVMPGMDGHETCRRIKALEGEVPKVVIVTGKIDAVDAVKAREAGCDDYTAKTTAFELLLESIKKLIAG